MTLLPISQYRQPFLIADTNTADTEKCADISDTDTGVGPSLMVMHMPLKEIKKFWDNSMFYFYN